MDTYDQYFNCVCRTCMNELLEAFSFEGDKKPQGWLSIFDRIEEEQCSLPIAELLTQAVPQIEVHPSDQLSKKICCNCLQQLLSVYRFQQMCLQSEEQMRQQVSNKQTDLSIPTTAMEGEKETKNAGSNLLDRSSIPKPLFQTAEQIVNPEALEMDDKSHLQQIDQSLEDSTDSQGNFSELIKNEPIEDDEPSVEYSEDDTIQAITVKGEMLAIESEEQQINETKVKAHRIKHDEDRPYECPHCPRRFKTTSNLYHHKAIHSGVEREACDICGKSFNKYWLKQHKLTHGGERPHKCHLCEKSFLRLDHLRAHIRIHTGEKPYQCEYCDRSFSESGHRMYHMRLHLGDKIHRCELCPLAFAVHSELRVHFATHKNEDPETRERNMKALKEVEAELQIEFTKTETPQSSKQQFAIKNTETRRNRPNYHQDEDKTYECPSCPRRFNTYVGMYQHKAIHEGIKRKDCDICGKSVIKNHLKQHKRTHNKVKPNKCDFCEKRFTRPTDLRIHMRVHTGEKPYKCKYCERSFSASGQRMKHMRNHLGDNVHRCELCPLAFPAPSELREHLTTHKNEDPETRERNMKALKEAEAELQEKLSKKSTQQSSKDEIKSKRNVKTHHTIQDEDLPFTNSSSQTHC